MSKINVIGLFTLAALSVCAHTSWAMTIAQLKENNNKVLELDSQIVIAKKTAELAPFKVVPPAKVQIGKRAATAPDESGPEEAFKINAIHGDASNPVADIQYQNTILQRKRGESAFNGWKVVSIAGGEVRMARTAKKGKEQTKTLYLSINAGQSSIGRDATQSQSPLPLPLPLPGPGAIPVRPATSGYVPFPQALQSR